MMRIVRNVFTFALVLLFNAALHAEVILPRVIGSNMVLQRDKPVPVWGTSAAGEKITVQFKNQVKHTVSDASGNWKVVLDPLQASSEPSEMIISGTNTIKLENILVGEVWLCSGQSNMEYAMRKLEKVKPPVKNDFGYPVHALEEANNPNIRIFLVKRKELVKPDSLHQTWRIAQGQDLRTFSAAGYFFAKELQARLGIPVGMIESAVSGSPIEPWVPAEAFASSSYFKGKQVHNDPGKFYTPMIEPLAPFALRGFLWYQGETNCFLDETISYTYKMKTLINSWRSAWKDDSLPFYYVQIAPFYYSKSKGKVALNENTEPEFWEAQAVAMNIPHTGMIVTTDLVNSPEDLHPTYKWEVGRRLALWALANDYKKSIVYSGPMYQSAKFKRSKAIVSFKHTGSGLVNKAGNPLNGFEIAGNDGKFVKADAEIKGNQVLVSAKNIKRPTAVRFEWTEAPQPDLYNKEGLPALPFRTNNPLISQFKSSESK